MMTALKSLRSLRGVTTLLAAAFMIFAAAAPHVAAENITCTTDSEGFETCTRDNDIAKDPKTTVALKDGTLTIYSDKKTSAGDSGTTNGMEIATITGWGSSSQSLGFSSTGDTGKMASSTANDWSYQITKNPGDSGLYTVTIYKGNAVVDSLDVTLTPYLPSQAPVEKCLTERIAKEAAADAYNTAAAAATTAAETYIGQYPENRQNTISLLADANNGVVTAATKNKAIKAADKASKAANDAKPKSFIYAEAVAKADFYTAIANLYIARDAANAAQTTYETCLKSQPQ